MKLYLNNRLFKIGARCGTIGGAVAAPKRERQACLWGE